jgi:hypothetical protein
MDSHYHYYLTLQEKYLSMAPSRGSRPRGVVPDAGCVRGVDPPREIRSLDLGLLLRPTDLGPLRRRLYGDLAIPPLVRPPDLGLLGRRIYGELEGPSAAMEEDGTGGDVAWRWRRRAGGGGREGETAAKGARQTAGHEGRGGVRDFECSTSTRHTTETKGFNPITNQKLRPVCNLLRHLHIDFTPNCFGL